MLRLHEAGFSLRQIAKLVSSGRNTVTRTVNIAQEKELSYEEIAQWSSEELENMFKPDKDKKDQPVSYYVMPDYKQLAKELAKPGVTMQLLWEEYAQECRLNNKIYYKLTQFKKHFNDYLYKNSFIHVLHHKAGEQVQVDWTGKRPQWIDPMTGEIIKGELFVEKQNNPASKCHFIPAVLFKKMRQLSDRICLFQHVCQFRPAGCLLQ